MFDCTNPLLPGHRLSLCALAAALALAPSAEAATRVPYQAQIQLSCSTGKCAGVFPALFNIKRLELQQVICHATVASSVHLYRVEMTYPDTVGGFVYDLALDSKTYSGTNFYEYVFGQDGPFIVPSGKALSARMTGYGGTFANARCSIHGHKVTSG